MMISMFETRDLSAIDSQNENARFYSMQFHWCIFDENIFLNAKFN